MIPVLANASTVRHTGGMSAGPAPRTARALAREELTRQILQTAREHLTRVGPGELSLRAVARDLGMASSAVYRYFPSRDALLTGLILRAFGELADALEAADASVADRADLGARWRAACGTVRAWARAHPHDYALVYGSPVPGYAAPRDTVDPVDRIGAVFGGILIDLAAGESARSHPEPRLTQAQRAAIEPIRAAWDHDLPAELVARGVTAWCTVMGVVSMELFGHLTGGVVDGDAYFGYVVEQLATDLGLSSSPQVR